MEKKTSRLAILSVVLGILRAISLVVYNSGTIFQVCHAYFGLIAILIGIYALYQIKQSPDLLCGRGLAIAGIILNIAVFLLICIYALLCL